MEIIERSKAHLADVDMGYARHFCFSMTLSLYFLLAAFYACVHGIVPGVFVTTSSDVVKILVELLEHKPSKRGT